MRSLPIPAALPLAAALMLFLSGCGDDRPYSGAPPSSEAPASAPAPVASAAPPPAPDPLLSGGQAIPTDDPLLPHDSQTPIDPLASTDPLQGQTMPTDHSHWLRGQVQDARLIVLVNGIRAGEYTGLVDQDITMKLRRGINSVTFLYAPRRADASARIDLLESEHDPPIAPLATFQSTPLSRDSADSQDAATLQNAAALKPTTQSFTFVAK
jgi:hypothetical protein